MSIVGKYRLERELGAGGMGTVWLAAHNETGKHAAIKILHSEYTSSDDICQRFFNEARAAGAVSDPGIVEIFDFGYTPEGHAYIVMELLDGESLESRLRRVGKLPLGDALRVGRQVSSSLGAAHARGIVHRDLKPENIFLTRDPAAPGGERAKILDFGIAKLEWSSNVKTRTAAVMGTPMYMSPEQCRGDKGIDQRSDVYAMGCLLFALLAGYPPFYAEGPGQVFLMHLQQPPPTIASRGVNVPPAVEALIARCLGKQPDQRFANGAEVATAIDAVGYQELVVGPAASVALPAAPSSRAGLLVWVAILLLLVGTIVAIATVAS